MQKQSTCIWMLLLLVAGIAISCSPPHHFWKQQDVESQELNDSSGSRRILIAARRSTFKKAVIDRLVHNLKEEPVAIMVTGINNLATLDPDQYAVSVFINTCMVGQYDFRIGDFIRRMKEPSGCIVLTTAGDSKWQLKKKNDDPPFDAISSASHNDSAVVIADDISRRVKALIDAGN